mmetsp:Transcript_16192/g.30485  ORF Transcript_16192/g.30485 Transcript_16192/m.30485 type:complete len:270 (-) Transcript_16192:205-1014(-)
MHPFTHYLVLTCLFSFGCGFLPPSEHGRQPHHGGSVAGSSVFGGQTRRPSSATTRTTAASTRLYGDVDAARRYISDGMSAFRRGQVRESIALFDQAQALEPRLDPYLWQRGISYYYANDFDKASQQFRRDVQVNPLDVEEIVWDIASQCRGSGGAHQFPIANPLTLPKGQSDRRPIMAVVYQLFQGTTSEHALARFATLGKRPSDEFYAYLYLGLFAESALQDDTKAEWYLRQALHTDYTQTLGTRDYMTDVARVHCQLRCWGGDLEKK